MAFTIIIERTETTLTVRNFKCFCDSQREHEEYRALTCDPCEDNFKDRVLHTGSITLPGGQTIQDGQGASRNVGTDSYPVTIIGWTKSGQPLYVQAATARATKNSDHYGVQNHIFAANPDGHIKAAKWTTRRGRSFFTVGGYAHLSVNGYAKHSDPHI